MILFNGHNIKILGLLVMAFLSPAVEMKKDSKLYKESFNLAKNSFEVVLGKYKPDQIKKLRKTNFFVMTYFRDRPIAQKF